MGCGQAKHGIETEQKKRVETATVSPNTAQAPVKLANVPNDQTKGALEGANSQVEKKSEVEDKSLSKAHFERVLIEPENKIRKTKIICTLG